MGLYRYINFIALILLVFVSCSHEGDISYSEEIKPLLNRKCLRCHGGIRALGGFSLLFPEQALAVNESGKPAIIPGKPGASELINRIKHPDPELKMPQEGDLLTDEEIRLLEKWIRQGAKFDEHWAYRSLEEPAIPQVETQNWGKNAIDKFVLKRMADVQLSPNQPADLHTLLRRISFDLTGLPPDLDTLKLNLEDLSYDNLEKAIDHMLSSLHYGEHLAALWLDLARYADSNGYEKDMGRSIWRFRDWVINAFNDDMPFNQFTIEQLAGDLLPNPTKDQLIATAFHRNTMTNTEGGTEDEEFRTMSVIDRVNTTFEVWQGTTISCVQCHAHPYDPFRQEDFYEIFAYFNNTQDADIDSEYPYILEHADSTINRIHSLADEIKRLDNQYSKVSLNEKVEKGDIRQIVFPRLFGDFADDFQDVLIQDNGGFNNSAYNANNQKHKNYYLVFSDINFDDLTGIRYHYFSRGDDARIDIYLDNLAGEPVLQTQMIEPKTKEWDWMTQSIDDLSGNHDLIFHFLNTSGDFRTGVVSLSEIELVYNEKPLSQALKEAQDSLLRLYRQGIKTPVMKERSDLLKRKTHVFERGNYLVKGKEVEPDVPEILNKDFLKVPDRLAFAQWLVSKNNALTPRVIVNRIWGYIFGTGLVSTPEDFGTQGSSPSHPQLLDYLAYQFSHDWQWSVKRLVKEIVSSATYQQSSVVDQLKLNIDPYNAYYSRGNRVRLSAEQIRDQALAVSGLLNRTIGGESVMPPQPEGVWQVIYSSAKWEAEKEEDKYRRGLYTYWKRTTPYPSMIAFDSPSREFCVSQRIITNTPLQALVTLNDTVYLEAAHQLALYMKTHADKNLKEALSLGYQKALLSIPDAETLDVLEKLYYQASEARAERISLTEEEGRTLLVESLTVVANAIMNLDAFLTKS